MFTVALDGASVAYASRRPLLSGGRGRWTAGEAGEDVLAQGSEYLRTRIYALQELDMMLITTE
jgi:hypothetical protein